MRAAESRFALLWLALLAFAEASFFPVPPDVVLWPMALARPQRAYLYAAVCTVASVVGGMAGYAIGFYLTDFAQHLLALTGNPHALAGFQAQYARWGVWVILVKGLTPIPYKLVTIASGLAHFSFPIFVAASIATRGGRFLMSALVLKRWGPAMLPIIERRLLLIAVGVIALAVAGVLLLKFVG
jgi:membrane protein YqaA with SNARE-associated domain